MSAEVFGIVFPLWIEAFVFTLLVEIPIFVLVARMGEDGKACPIWRQALAGAAGTCITHPLLWFAWPLALKNLALLAGAEWISEYTTYIISGELIVATVEVFTFLVIARPIPLSRAIAASFIANAGSYGLGALLQGLGWMGQ